MVAAGLEPAGEPQVAHLIDHTLLAPEATGDDIRRLCSEAVAHCFAGVCVHPWHIPLASSCLEGASPLAIAVVGFPLGAMSTAAKAFEARDVVRVGAQEVDMVINLGALKSRDHAYVFADIREVVRSAGQAPTKVILETSKLDDDEIVMGATLARAAGAAFVKTSTGFGGGGATVEHVALIRAVVGPNMGVKASGGVRSLEKALAMIRAGATRIGASASVAIVRGRTSADDEY